MRKIAIILAFLAATSARAGELYADRPGVDLGPLAGGPVHEHRFEVANAGSEPLEILGVRRDCGCVEASVEKTRLAPKEKTGVVLRLRTLGQPDGRRSWNAWVQYRQGQQSGELRLGLTALLRNDIVVEPPQLAFHVENALRQELRVTDRRTPPLRLTAARSSCPALKASLLPEGNGVTRVVLEVSGRDLEPGRHDVALNLYSDDAGYRQLEVPVTLTRVARPRFSASPASLQVEAGVVTTELVRIRGNGTRIKIGSVKASDPAIRSTWSEGPYHDATLKVQVDARRLSVGSHSLQVELAEPAGETVNIDISTR